MSGSENEEDLPSAAECETRCQTFAAITGTDSALAMFYLQDREWDVQRAVNAYFESQDSSCTQTANLKRKNQTSDDGDGLSGSSKSLKSEKVSEVEDSEPHRIRIMSWNIDGLDKPSADKRTKEICQIIKRENPHVVFLQEVIPNTVSLLEDNCPEYKVIPGGHLDYFTAILLKNKFTKLEKLSTKDFPNTVMMRNMLIVQCSVKEVPFTVITSHLESTAEFGEERKLQLKQCFDEIKTISQDRTVIFGGDLNLREKELNAIGGIPKGISDVWEATGSRKECLYTWDMNRNTNLVFNSKFKPRARFDRLYIKPSNPPTVEPVYFEFVGLEKVKSCGKFPSDHWGLLTHYNILSKVAKTLPK